MAQAVILKGLAERLVTSTTGRNREDSAFKKLTDRTVKNLKDQSHARTNQFAVKAKLDGLVEKFSVLNRDELANALETDLTELPKDNRWMPEILSLLLELSDRPVEKVSLEDVERTAVKAPEESLTWEEIMGDDPLDEPDIWEDVERGYHSSGDDEFSHDLESEPTISTKATSLDEEDPPAIAKLYLSQPNESSIESIKSARNRIESLRENDEPYTLSELMVVRNILSMMHGLPTDLFDVDECGRVTVLERIRISSASSSSLSDLLVTAAEMGSAVNFLRQWVPDASHSYLQTIHGSLEKQISSVSGQLSLIEQRYITPSKLIAVSALDALTEIEDIARPLVHLSAIVEKASQADADNDPFALLDELYDESSLAHLAGDMPLFNMLVAVFLAGFKTYLRPVATWITKGLIVDQDRDVLFAKDSDQECEPGKLWQKRFEMRSLSNGSAFAPRCISAKVKALFALGKSRAFLNQLDSSPDSISDEHAPTILPDFEVCLQQVAEESLAPFSQLFDDTLDSWISNISTDCSPLLRSKLFDEHGLKKTLDALPIIFFSQNGITFQDFADTVIDRLNASQHLGSWNDQFLLTELAQSTFGSSSAVSSDSVHISFAEEKDLPAASSLVRKLAGFTINYKLSWPVQNVMQSTTPDAHAKVFIFLLQIYSSGSLLQDRFLDFRSRQSVSPGTLKLRQKLLWFSNSLFDYVTKTAQVLHKTMLEAMERALDIDEMVAVFAGYEKRLLTNLLLAANLEPVRDAVVGILEVSELLAKTTREARIAALDDQFEKSIRFLTAGIRGVGRAGGESFLEGLAETIEWGVR